MEKEKGAAEIRIELDSSIIKVYHFDGHELFSKQAIEGDWSRLWAEIKRESKPLTPQSLETFLIQPGINIQGVCDEAGIAKQYLNRCRKNKELPGRKVLEKLVPVIIKYGFNPSTL